MQFRRLSRTLTVGQRIAFGIGLISLWLLGPPAEAGGRNFAGLNFNPFVPPECTTGCSGFEFGPLEFGPIEFCDTGEACSELHAFTDYGFVGVSSRRRPNPGQTLVRTHSAGADFMITDVRVDGPPGTVLGSLNLRIEGTLGDDGGTVIPGEPNQPVGIATVAIEVVLRTVDPATTLAVFRGSARVEQETASTDGILSGLGSGDGRLYTLDDLLVTPNVVLPVGTTLEIRVDLETTARTAVNVTAFADFDDRPLRFAADPVFNLPDGYTINSVCGTIEDNTFCNSPDSGDNDDDGRPDVCDDDDDNDNVLDETDNCPLVANEQQEDRDGDSIGDVCDDDNDNDTIPDVSDNCPFVDNVDQTNVDGDAAGLACDCDDGNPNLIDCNTPVSAGPFSITDETTGIEVAFAEVTAGGDTTIVARDCNFSVPDGLILLPECFDIQTTATFVGDVTLCFFYDDTDLDPLFENNLFVLSCDSDTGPCEQLETDSLDRDQNLLCGKTDHFSIFAVAYPDTVFLRADANSDGTVNIADPSFLANFLFGVAPATPPPCDAAADANGDGNVNIADPSFIANFIFGIEPAQSPPAPHPECGPPEEEVLPCESSPGCAPE